MINFIDPTAKIGDGSVVWWFAVILQDVVIGENCSVGSHVEIGRGGTIGNNTRIGKGAFLPPNSTVGNNCFIAPGVYFADDKFPMAGNVNYLAQPPVVEDYAVVGIGSVVLPGVRIGRNAFVGAGSVVTKDVPAGVQVYGNAASERVRTFEHLRGEYGWMGGSV